MNIRIIIDCPSNFKEQAKYVFNTFFTVLGFPYSICTSYKRPTNGELLIYYGNNPKNEDIKIIYNPNTRLDEKATDIIYSSYVHLTRKEEKDIKERDIWECFPARLSYFNSKKILDKAVVDKYIMKINKKIIALKIPMLKKDIWPDNKKYAVSISHDVDSIRKNKIFRFGKDPYYNFENWMELENSKNIRSTFFFFAKHGKQNKRDPRYNVKRIKEVVKKLSENGWEIGLHGSYDSYLDSNKLESEKKILEEIIRKKIKGIRQHYLRFSVPQTWNMQQKSSFCYDSTLGYNKVAGYRAGISFPFSYPGSKIIEMPLVVMDGILFWEKKFTSRRAVKYVNSLIQMTKRNRGLITLSWHQRIGDSSEYKEWWKTYIVLLDTVSNDKDAWIATFEEIYDWWNKRNNLEFNNISKDSCILNPKKDIDKINLSLYGVNNIKIIGSDHRLIRRKNNIHIELRNIKKHRPIKIICQEND